MQNVNPQGKKRSLGFMNAQELQWKLQSKQDFITYFDQHRKSIFILCLTPSAVQLYLPPEDVINKDFLREVFVEKKQLFKKTEVRHIAVPHYDELSVKNLWPEVKKDPVFLSYFPSVYPKGKGPPREYFFNVLNTVMPEYLAKILDHANKERMAADGQKMQSEAIHISPYWEEQLKAMPYLSSKYKTVSVTSILYGPKYCLP